MPVTVTKTEFQDFEALRNIVQDTRTTDVVPLGRGRMTGSMSHLSLDDNFGMSMGQFSQGVRLRGIVSPHRHMLGMVLTTGGRAMAQSQDLKAGDVLVIPAGEERYSAFPGGNTRYVSTLIAPDELQAVLTAQRGGRDLSIGKHATVLQNPDSGVVADNIATMSMLSNALAEVEMPAQAASFHKLNVMDLLISSVLKDAPYHDAPAKSAVRLVREVDRYTDEVGTRPIHIIELCARFKVPRRTLFHAFEDVMRMAPVCFMRQKRLRNVHSVLLQAPADVLIRNVALAHGFIEQGKFAREYRRLFGERPSDTLRRARMVLTVAGWTAAWWLNMGGWHSWRPIVAAMMMGC